MRGIGDVHDARADTEIAHVPHVEEVAVSHDLHAVALPRQIGVTDELEAARLERARQRTHGRIVGRFDEADAPL